MDFCHLRIPEIYLKSNGTKPPGGRGRRAKRGKKTGRRKVSGKTVAETRQCARASRAIIMWKGPYVLHKDTSTYQTTPPHFISRIQTFLDFFLPG